MTSFKSFVNKNSFVCTFFITFYLHFTRRTQYQLDQIVIVNVGYNDFRAVVIPQLSERLKWDHREEETIH